MLHQGSPVVLLNKQKHNHLIKWFDGVIREIKLIRLADFHGLACAALSGKFFDRD